MSIFFNDFQPSSDSLAFNSLSEALHGVARWTEALHGRGELVEALTTLLKLLKARQGSLLRLYLETTTENAIATVNLSGRGDSLSDPGMSFSRYLFGYGIGKARPRTVWYLSEIDLERSDEGGPRSRLPFADGQTREVVAVVLAPGKRVSDILEIHFTRWLSPREKKLLSIVMVILSSAWQCRRANIVFDAIAEHQRHLGQTVPGFTEASLFGATNPAGLSKAEYRVCVLLALGLRAKGISERLRVSESTIRSHLRSIYAKTETTGQYALMHRLLTPSVPGGERLPASGPPTAAAEATPGPAATVGLRRKAP